MRIIVSVLVEVFTFLLKENIMHFFKKLVFACLVTSFAVSPVLANHNERKEEALRDQKNSKLMGGVVKGAGIAVLFAIASAVTHKLANLDVLQNQNPYHHGLIYSLLQGASSGFAYGTIPCVFSGISGNRESSEAWLGMAISCPIIGMVSGGMVSKPVTENAKDIPVLDKVFTKLDAAHLHPNSAATLGISSIALFTGIKPGVHRVQDAVLGRFYRESNHRG
jgi:hypothetical protein